MGIIYPPRPASKILPSMLPDLEKRGRYLVQRKFNGDRCLIHFTGNGKVNLYNRYGKAQKYKMPPFLRKELLGLNLDPASEYWLDGELMDVRIPDTIVFYDVLHATSYLYGRSLIERLDLLRKICNNPVVHAEPAIALAVNKHLWLAEAFESNFADRFKDFLHLSTIEGLVLKERASLLSNWGQKPYEVNWQIRCRKPGPTYKF
jgi:ATP-dependent DNA ligase